MAERPRLSDPEKLKDAFKQAAEIAAVVPATMQEAAFHRALDQILGEEKEPSGRPPGQRTPPGGGADTSGAVPVQQLIDGINRTAYPEIGSATKVLDRALAVLRLAKQDFDTDGLTAPDIAKVLTDKFRQRTSRQAVAQALGAANTMVDTRARGRTTVYRIMQEGEDHLDQGGHDQTTSGTGTTSRRRRRAQRRSKPASSASTTTETTTPPATPRAQKGTTRRRGPKTMLGELIDEGYFSQARTINDAQEQLRHKKGMRFSLHDLSPALVRLLRDGRLDRDRNTSGQYEYRAK